MHKLTGVEPTPITADEIPAFAQAIEAAFHDVPTPAAVDRLRKKLEPERSLVIRDGEQIVATTSIYTRRMTVPGGELPIAGVTQVGVLATHRRRGMLTALMRRQLADIHELGNEAVAALWATESGIYGRFGYGVASMVTELDVAVRDARLRSMPTAQAARLFTPADAIDAMREIYDSARPSRPGTLDRAGPWWEIRVDDPPDDRDGYGPLRAVVIEGAAYALYSVKVNFDFDRPASQVAVREALAVTPEAHAAIWSFLLGLDLTRRLVYELAAADDPLRHLVTSAEAVRERVADSLFVRLVDVPRALQERTYAAPFEVVFEIADELCPWNAGRYALRWDGETATCAPTALPAGLALGVAELGAAYLGGTTLEVLARAGRVRELRGGALAAASRAFRGDRAPYCPEIF
jgi:predicted acetyltransferase